MRLCCMKPAAVLELPCWRTPCNAPDIPMRHAAPPRRVDFLTHDISWHVPHHVSTKIPWYNLRKATSSLRENWGQYMTECTFNWRVMKNIFTECHVYDEQNNYKPFDYKKEEPFFALQRRWLPNGM